jgi:hypothetical protein
MQTNILFRASGVGALMVDGRGAVITENQLQTIKDFETRLREGGKLTDKQKDELKRLKEKRDAPFELSDTAKQFIDDTWLWNEKGFFKKIKSPYIDKGIFGEEVGIDLLTELDGNFYAKNTERKTKGNLTGHCDINTKIDSKKIIQDVKCCWDAKTFKNAEWTKLYEWQGRTYLDLYDADEFWLRYVLIDCPPHLVQREKERLWRQYYDESMSMEEAQRLEEMMKPMFEQIERNLVYSSNSNYTLEERVKTYKITRDDVVFKQLLDRIPDALKYYNSIKLNDVVFK